MSQNEDITIPGDEAFLSFGGWAKSMPNPPALHERRRYTVDVECVAAGVKTSEKGDRFTRSLAILRVVPVVGVVPPPKTEDEGDDTPPMFDDQGNPSADASADEGDEIRAQQEEKRAARAAADAAAAEAAQDAAEPGADPNDPDADPWPGDAAGDGSGSAADVAPSENMDGTVTPMFKEAKA